MPRWILDALKTVFCLFEISQTKNSESYGHVDMLFFLGGEVFIREFFQNPIIHYLYGTGTVQVLGHLYGLVPKTHL